MLMVECNGQLYWDFDFKGLQTSTNVEFSTRVKRVMDEEWQNVRLVKLELTDDVYEFLCSSENYVYYIRYEVKKHAVVIDHKTPRTKEVKFYTRGVN